MFWIKVTGFILSAVTLVNLATWPRGYITPAQTNQLNAESEIDRADTVTVTVSTGEMRWRDRTWTIYANEHTPRGRFRISPAKTGAEFGIDSSAVLPFFTVAVQKMPKNNPQYAYNMSKGSEYTTYAIHADNRSPGQVGAGCILADERSLAEMAVLLQGATLVIED